MSDKGFEAETTYQTPNFDVTEEKPFKSENNRPKKVDINVLKARVQELQNKENKKNILIFSIFLVALAVIGILLTK
tara:strand:+ start:196 stop:423 length:228 start_codon:yes stop_codon:yes gene_type:complete